jgi:methylated-DNA-[protein]-cysteine S-methyltransferase
MARGFPPVNRGPERVVRVGYRGCAILKDMLEWMDAEVADGVVVRIVASRAGVRAIQFEPEDAEGGPSPGNDLLIETAAQLRAYFAESLREFRLPLDMVGTDFQLRVWNQLLAIGYGETRSYSWVAQAIGHPSAVRAVGAANGSNPVPIVVPCHRVIGANGKLVGYGGGLPLKQRLLALERRNETMLLPLGLHCK